MSFSIFPQAMWHCTHTEGGKVMSWSCGRVTSTQSVKSVRMDGSRAVASQLNAPESSQETMYSLQSECEKVPVWYNFVDEIMLTCGWGHSEFGLLWFSPTTLVIINIISIFISLHTFIRPQMLEAYLAKRGVRVCGGRSSDNNSSGGGGPSSGGGVVSYTRPRGGQDGKSGDGSRGENTSLLDTPVHSQVPTLSPTHSWPHPGPLSPGAPGESTNTLTPNTTLRPSPPSLTTYCSLL